MIPRADLMLENPIKVGQHFSWNCEADGTAGEAVVAAARNDRQEGLSPEAEEYVALWIDANGLTGSRAQQSFEILLGTDGQSYLDGAAVTIEVQLGN
jgi:hypothetical protein